MSETELRVVCRECGAEVSPYITECPYCGARLRKRAPKLEQRDGTLEPKPTARARLGRLLPKIGRGRFEASAGGGWTAPVAYVAAAALLLLVGVATGASLAGIGAVSGPIEGEQWRFITAPFAYDNVGYLFIVAAVLGLFGSGIGRRLGEIPTAVLLIGCGALGALGAYGIDRALETAGPLIAGGNSIALGVVAAWVMLRRAEAKGSIEHDYDLIGAGVAAAVLLALPLVETSADVFAGLVGALVGGLAGLIAAKLRPE